MARWNEARVDVWEVSDAITGKRLAFVTSQRKAREHEEAGRTVVYRGVWKQSAVLDAAKAG